MWRIRWWNVAFGVVLGAGVLAHACWPAPVARVASFNIEDFPRSDRQVVGAFDAMRSLRAGVIAVQEITDTERFAREARDRLGPTWHFVFETEGTTQHHLGILYDASHFSLLSVATYRETMVYPGAKPAFEARLRRVDSSEVLRVITVHLKAGGDGFPIRAAQLARLTPVLRAAKASGDILVVLGDFNATGLADRTAIATAAEAAQLAWSSEHLGCSSYWSLPEECRGTPLDQVLTSEPVDVAAAGPCANSCNPGRSCPLWVDRVSDHCPVVAALSR